ncbi:hypothetical protein PAHAL_2G146300 [Panicum hallii]|uniref:Uncharacterized protein n=1 Tax=Panicum hallii TaxID=206008 RepID=A0A2T8KP79_9POAL|nr:hypothetical protein PAHAL_2G146300 [Panicum hallii]
MRSSNGDLTHRQDWETEESGGGSAGGQIRPPRARAAQVRGGKEGGDHGELVPGLTSGRGSARRRGDGGLRRRVLELGVAALGRWRRGARWRGRLWGGEAAAGGWLHGRPLMAPVACDGAQPCTWGGGPGGGVRHRGGRGRRGGTGEARAARRHSGRRRVRARGRGGPVAGAAGAAGHARGSRGEKGKNREEGRRKKREGREKRKKGKRREKEKGKKK